MAEINLYKMMIQSEKAAGKEIKGREIDEIM